ncbi:hypothetical protein [Hoeflea ulvae]|uniref:Uncharacterized protein n=1 Tax=Hoeflea ulvae TaxID=2983764 RepID=A0ABT3YL62_9HYPH|nr:hypothetical protein [Hoeflea ulvae]MCY0096639.1 hypothetical protein [Hoeflea ulvae]
MPMNKKHVIYTYAILAAVAIFGTSLIAKSESEAGQTAAATVRTLQGEAIPGGAFGVVIVEDAREASLLHLRGIAGSGFALLRETGGKNCLRVPLRFVAGDFGGDSIGTTRAETIRLTLNDAGLVQALISGDDIVSDQYRVGRSSDDQIAIQEGLSVGHGFVLNPGKSLLEDMFGPDADQVVCIAD